MLVGSRRECWELGGKGLSDGAGGSLGRSWGTGSAGLDTTADARATAGDCRGCTGPCVQEGPRCGDPEEETESR